MIHKLKSNQSAMFYLKIIVFLYFVHGSKSTIDGLSFMDPLMQRPKEAKDDPCHPLYWYPREVPEYCYLRTMTPPAVEVTPPASPSTTSSPVPLPPPAPFPYPPISVPVPIPVPLPMPYPPPMFPPPMPFPPMSVPIRPSIPVPFYPGPAVPNPAYFSPYNRFQYPGFEAPRIGFVPGIPGIVSEDGGVNIMPFSDAYSDMLEAHKQKVIRRRLEKYMRKYERYPWRSSERRRRREREQRERKVSYFNDYY